MPQIFGLGVIVSVLTAVAVPVLAGGAWRLAVPPWVGRVHDAEGVGARFRGCLSEGQSSNAWRAGVTVQRFTPGALQDPVADLGRVTAALRAVSPSWRATLINPVPDGPHVTAVAIAGCGVSPGTGGGEGFALRAASGGGAMHDVLHDGWRRGPPRQEVRAAPQSFYRAVPCGTGRADAACPEGGILS